MTTSPHYSSFGNPRPIAVNHRRRRHCRPEVELTDLRIHSSSRLPVSFVGAARTRRGRLSTSQRQSMAVVASSTSTEALRRRASLLPVAGCHQPLFAVRTPPSTSRVMPCSSSLAASGLCQHRRASLPRRQFPLLPSGCQTAHCRDSQASPTSLSSRAAMAGAPSPLLISPHPAVSATPNGLCEFAMA